MTHGDALLVLKGPTFSKEERLKALKVIFEEEYKHDFCCLSKTDMWNTMKFLYKELMKKEEK